MSPTDSAVPGLNSATSRGFQPAGRPIPIAASDTEESGVHDLWGGIDLGDIPVMPEALVPFDAPPITRAEARNEAEGVFLVWLKAKLDGRSYIPLETQTVCADPLVSGSFIPAWPDPGDYGTYDARGRFVSGSHLENPEYNRLFAIANIEAARARRECMSCTIRVQCLADSIRQRKIEPDQVQGVWGGWEQRARDSIQARFDEMRRDYELERMDADERSRYERRALAIDIDPVV